MAVRVFVPALLRPLCGGAASLDVPAGTLGEVLTSLDSRCPGLHARVVEEGRLRPDVAVAVDGEILSLGLHEPVSDGSELALVPALGGG